MSSFFSFHPAPFWFYRCIDRHKVQSAEGHQVLVHWGASGNPLWNKFAAFCEAKAIQGAKKDPKCRGFSSSILRYLWEKCYSCSCQRSQDTRSSEGGLGDPEYDAQDESYEARDGNGLFESEVNLNYERWWCQNMKNSYHLLGLLRLMLIIKRWNAVAHLGDLAWGAQTWPCSSACGCGWPGGIGWEVNLRNMENGAGGLAGLNLWDSPNGSLAMCLHHDSDDSDDRCLFVKPWLCFFADRFLTLQVNQFNQFNQFNKRFKSCCATAIGDQPLQSLTCPTSSTCNLCLRQIGWHLMECCEVWVNQV